ncbi:MAG: META domain-containing protein [Nitrospirales bacterium]|nr:META domain-containing protein [Nitrospirales bacterium]
MILPCISQLVLTAVISTVASFGVLTPNELLSIENERVAEINSGGTPPELRGTSWRWLGFTSSAESLTVPEPERYTLTFSEDRAIVRADCNRGTAPVASRSLNALEIGPTALTRRRCPQGSLSNRFAGDLSNTVRYSIRGGELYLELSNDSGFLRFAKESG